MNALPLATLLFSSLTLGAARPAPRPAPAVATQKVTLLIADLASTQSVVKLNFYNNSETFLKKGQHALHLEVRPEGKTEIALPVDLAPGEWAVALSQDTNNNDKLDKNFLGIPTEPFAFSNNIKPRLSAPTFQECKFTVTGPGQVISIGTWNNL